MLTKKIFFRKKQTMDCYWQPHNVGPSARDVLTYDFEIRRNNRPYLALDFDELNTALDNVRQENYLQNIKNFTPVHEMDRKWDHILTRFFSIQCHFTSSYDSRELKG